MSREEEIRDGITKRETAYVVVAYVFLPSPIHSSRDKSSAGSPITALTAVSLRGLPLRLHHPSYHRGFVFRPAYSWRKYHKYSRRTATSPSGYFCVPFSILLFSRRLVFLFSSLVIPLQAARMSKRVVRKEWQWTTLSVASRRVATKRRLRVGGWRLEESPSVGQTKREKTHAVKRAQRKKEGERKCNEGRLRRKWKVEELSRHRAAVCYSFLLFFPLNPHPFARAAALFMTLSTSLAAVFLRHYTWKNSTPRRGNSI